MQARRVGSVLLALGVVVGVVGSVGLAVGFDPSQLPAALIKVAAYKLTFLAAFGLIAAGAVVARAARREEKETSGSIEVPAKRAQLGAGVPSEVHVPARKPKMRERR